MKDTKQSTDNSRLPINLPEALSATPLAYLLPTQPLSLPLNNATIPSYNTIPLNQQGHLFNQHIMGNDPALINYLNSNLQIQPVYHDTSVPFGVVNNITTLEKGVSASPSPSLFDNLSGVARNLISTVPLVDDKDLLKQTALEDELIPNQSDTSVTRSFVSTTSTSITTPLKKHNTDCPVSSDIKRRKTEISMEHLELEKISLSKLSEIITNKIALNDTDAEFESSDVWLELPNSSHILSDSILAEIEHLLLKFKGTSLVTNISFEHIDRLQNVLMKAITYANEIDWSPSSDISAQLKLTNNILNSCAVMLHVFNLGLEDKKVYLDTYLTEVLAFLYKFTDDYLLKSSTQQPNNSTFVNLVSRSVLLFSSYLVNHHVNDNLITKLEYLGMTIFFHPSEKNYNRIKMACIQLITTIFQYKADQRDFIVDEILSNLDRLPTHKLHSRQIKLQNGISIQLVTTLILNLIETVNLKDGQYINDLTIRKSSYTPEELSQKEKEDMRFKEYVCGKSEQRDKILKYIASGLVAKTINQPTTTTKQLFELILQDLLNIVELPEWYSSEALLYEITKTLIYITENQPSTIETYLLEMIGLIGSKMIQLKGKLDITIVEAVNLTTEYSHVYSYMNLFNNSFFHHNSGHFFISKWIELLINASARAELGDEIMSKSLSCLMDVLAAYYQGKSFDGFQKLEGNISSCEESVAPCFKSILLQSDFIKLYQSFFNQLLKSVDHPKIKSRSRALKNLASLIHKDDRLLSIPQVKQSLSNRINDSSALVKAAVLDIFDNYILSKPEMIPEFYQSIILSTDKSLSIRSKSIKIARRIFIDTDNDEIKRFCLEKILRRLDDDEESIVELAKSTLTDLLFLSVTDHLFTARVTINNLVPLVSRSERNWNLFENFLFDYILRSNDTSSLNYDKVLASCSNIINNIFSFVLDKMDSGNHQEVEQNLGLLSIFSKADKHFIDQDQLLMLQPYIEANHRAGSLISYYTLVILRNTLDHTPLLRDTFLSGVQASLFKRLTKFSIKELEYAMPCVWILSEMRKDTSKLANAAVSCLEKIKPFVEKVLKNDIKDSSPILQRLIYLIGNFGKSCDFEKHRNIFQRSNTLDLKERESILSLMTKNVLIFTRLPVNRQIRRAAIKNVVSICTTHPKLFLSDPVLKVLDQEFSSERFDFKDVIIQGLLEFLAREEKLTKHKVSKDSKESNKVSIDVDVFHGNSKSFENDGICASLVQKFLDPVLELCLHDDGEFSYVAVRYLRVIVRLGFANPRICIPTIIALQSSHIPYIRSVGLELHKELHEKHESLIDSSYINGFKLASDYCLKINPSMMFDNDLFFLKFYKVIGESKASRKRFLKHLTKSLRFDSHNMTKSDAISTYYYSLFMSVNIAECEYVANDEVYCLIEGLESVLNSEGVSIKSEVSQILDGNIKIEPEDSLKLSYLSSVIVNFSNLVNHLRTGYKLPESISESELINQKVKLHDKPPFTVRPFDPHENPENLYLILKSVPL